MGHGEKLIHSFDVLKSDLIHFWLRFVSVCSYASLVRRKEECVEPSHAGESGSAVDCALLREKPLPVRNPPSSIGGDRSCLLLKLVHRCPIGLLTSEDDGHYKERDNNGHIGIRRPTVMNDDSLMLKKYIHNVYGFFASFQMNEIETLFRCTIDMKPVLFLLRCIPVSSK